MKPFTMAAILFLFLCILIFIMYPSQGIELVTIDKEQQEVWIPLGNHSFTLEYIHSVDMLPVYEVFYIKNGNLYIRETYFYNVGIGMGEMLGRGRYVEDDGLLRIIDLNERVDSFYIHSGPIAQPQIVVGEKEYKLVDIFGPGKAILIRARRRNPGHVYERYLLVLKSWFRADGEVVDR